MSNRQTSAGSQSNVGNPRLWNTLIEQIVRGNVIPVIGEEMTYVNGESPLKTILKYAKLEYAKKKKSIYSDNFVSFTALMNHFNVSAEYEFYDEVANIIQEQEKVSLFTPNEILKEFLSIKYFPFVITTTVYPTVERAMRDIHGERLRVLTFCNDSSKNCDIAGSRDTLSPTLYYMFGKANAYGDDFVLSDTDLLQFSRSWLQPTDSDNRSKPANLANALSNKFLLVLGNNFQDWLLRFFWLAMKNDNVFDRNRKTPNGMEASEHTEKSQIDFLNSSNILALVGDLPSFVRILKNKLEKKEKELNPDSGSWFESPATSADVFISYSRADSSVVNQLYEVLKEKKLNVWYDKQNLGAGVQFLREIREAIRTCKLFVPVLTDNIRKQAVEPHVYRNEWKFAVEQEEQISPAIPYIVPLCENSFDMNDRLAGISDGIKAHNAETFSIAEPSPDLARFADVICKKLQEKQHIINHMIKKAE